MHIALCDDNVADRKQSERLLGRESDSRIHTTGGLYLDSFGHHEALLQAPMQYDLFFLDMVCGDTDAFALAHMLRKAGVTAPIVLCSSRLDYQSMENQPELVFHVKKPLKPEDISSCIDKALAIRDSLEKRFEIRCEQETHYIDAGSVVTVIPEGHLAKLVFADDTVLKMLGTLEDFYCLTESTHKFVFARKNRLVNLDYIAYFTMHQLMLTNGQSIPLWLNDWRFLCKCCPWKKKK